MLRGPEGTCRFGLSARILVVDGTTLEFVDNWVYLKAKSYRGSGFAAMACNQRDLPGRLCKECESRNVSPP